VVRFSLHRRVFKLARQMRPRGLASLRAEPTPTPPASAPIETVRSVSPEADAADRCPAQGLTPTTHRTGVVLDGSPVDRHAPSKVERAAPTATQSARTGAIGTGDAVDCRARPVRAAQAARRQADRAERPSAARAHGSRAGGRNTKESS
jgi:hypothetical protein